MESEEKLQQEVKEGNRQAMHQLYERYAGYAASVVRRYVSDSDAAHDLLQDSFVKVFTRIDSFDYRGEGSLRAWILRIVANESLNFVRQNQKFTFTDDMPDTPDEDPDEEQVPPKVVMDMVAHLPSGYRMIVNLYVFEGKKHKEIAQLLGIKESTSASQFLRAKRLLAKMINEYLNKQ